jgi:hypothetical protein
VLASSNALFASPLVLPLGVTPNLPLNKSERQADEVMGASSLPSMNGFALI